MNPRFLQRAKGKSPKDPSHQSKKPNWKEVEASWYVNFTLTMEVTHVEVRFFKHSVEGVWLTQHGQRVDVEFSRWFYDLVSWGLQ